MALIKLQRKILLMKIQEEIAEVIRAIPKKEMTLRQLSEITKVPTPRLSEITSSRKIPVSPNVLATIINNGLITRQQLRDIPGLSEDEKYYIQHLTKKGKK